MTRIAFTADLHVDEYGSRRDPETGLNARELDMLEAIRRVGHKARSRACEALVVAGDYTETKVPARGPRIARIARALTEGPERQIHLLGNHDIEQASDSIVTVLGSLPGWTGFSHNGIDLVGDVAICAIPFVSRSWARTLPGWETVPDAKLFAFLGDQYLTLARSLFVQAANAGARSAVLVGHQQLAGAQMTDSQRSFLGDVDLVIDGRALADIGYAAVIFGHVHRGQTVVEGPTPVLFTGSIERVDFAEEAEQKSFLVADVQAGQATLERVPLPARQYLTVRGDGSFNPAAVEDAVIRAIDLDPDVDTADLRRELERAGAFEVMEIRRRPVAASLAVGRISESRTASEALDEYFADDPDREALVERGRALLEAVSS